jgi:high-affinity K+ transport system ATPase subunit B
LARERIKVQLHEQPEVRGELLDTLSSLYNDLGDTDRAVALARERLNASTATKARGQLRVSCSTNAPCAGADRQRQKQRREGPVDAAQKYWTLSATPAR